MRIALCQINPTVGDLAGNVQRVLRDARRASRAGADLAVFPELCVTGYPPQDLLDRPAFLDDVDDAVALLAREAPDGLALLVGAPVRNETPVGKRLFNSALLLAGGAVRDAVSKTLLPTYDVFDEARYFEPCPERRVIEHGGVRLGVHLCEDMWNHSGGADGEQVPYHLYAADPIAELAALGVDLFVNLSASPYAAGKPAERQQLIRESCRERGVPFVYVNQVGANTELIFDGSSQVQSAAGGVLWHAPLFEEAFHVWDTEAPGGAVEVPVEDATAEVHDALVLGVRDYVAKTGPGVFDKALVGLSGGIDSAVTCAIAVAALGADRVVGVTMPSAYSSSGSVDDSRALAENLGIAFHEVPIRPAVDAFGAMLAPLFEGTEDGVAEENVQARARGVTLMAISNKFDHLLLTTGNKSEVAVGYSTLYGDMAGGLAVLADVFKTDVYRLAEHVNARAGRDVIPRSTITKPPSAELRPGQTDQDSLPPYDVLDAVLVRYVEGHASPAAIAAETGFDRALVDRVARLVDRSEYKRRQAAPGLRVSPKAFGSGRRLPIVMQRTRVTERGAAERVEGAPAAVGVDA
ncbi:NAD+ synthase [Rubrivirga sp. S365]|uniref:NAD+ synthase n=1 Tax=Rubrivirga sp. S365 TaxID=3076080 RepID=UPI0028C59353|nr:NAD+ synthase [Rubrivirga sp. S365]MDT7856475.1 NAD+ synthase [Rubrivirga sp. S365]